MGQDPFAQLEIRVLRAVKALERCRARANELAAENEALRRQDTPPAGLLEEVEHLRVENETLKRELQQLEARCRILLAKIRLAVEK